MCNSQIKSQKLSVEMVKVVPFYTTRCYGSHDTSCRPMQRVVLLLLFYSTLYTKRS